MPTPGDAVQIALEESPRYSGAPDSGATQLSTAVHYLPATSVGLAPNRDDINRDDEIRGDMSATANVVNAYNPTGSIGMRAYANAMTWLLECAGFTGTYTAGNGVITDPNAVVIPTGAARWVYLPRNQLTGKSLQVIQAFPGNGSFVTGRGYGVSGLTMTADGALTADLAGLTYTVTGTDPNLTPTYDSQALLPFLRGDLYLSWYSGAGTPDDFSIAISSPLQQLHTMTLDPPSKFPDRLEFGDEPLGVTGSLGLYNFSLTDIQNLLSASTFTATARWKSSKMIGATAYPYAIFFEMNCQVTGGGPAEMVRSRRHGGTVDFKAVKNESTGDWCKITLINSITSISTGIT